MDNTLTVDLDVEKGSAQMAPELHELISLNLDLITDPAINHSPAVPNRSYLFQRTFPIAQSKNPPLVRRMVLISGACTSELVTCLTDCVSMVLLAANVPKSIAIGAAIVANISPKILIGLAGEVQALQQAATMTEKANAVFTIFASIHRITGIQQILELIKHHHSWYHWFLCKAGITAKITTWASSDEISVTTENAIKLVIVWALIKQQIADPDHIIMI